VVFREALQRFSPWCLPAVKELWRVFRPGWILAIRCVQRRVFQKSKLAAARETMTTPNLHASCGAAFSIKACRITRCDTIGAMTSVLPYDPHPYLHEGMMVEVIQGPLQGVRGIFLRKEKHHRLVLGVRLIQQAAVVEIDVADVVSV